MEKLGGVDVFKTICKCIIAIAEFAIRIYDIIDEGSNQYSF